MISLITTTRERPLFLLEAASSVSEQIVPPDEWIIYIDEDEEGAVFYEEVKEIIKKIVPQAKFFGGDGKIGRVRALIKAHELASGDRLAMFDDDDLLSKYCIKEVNKHSDKPFVYTNFIAWEKDGKTIDDPERNKEEFSFDLEENKFHGLPFHLTVYSRELYDEVGGFDPTYEVCMDMDIKVRMSLIEKPFKINKYLYHYRRHRKRISSVKSSLQYRNRNRIKKWYREYLESA